MENIIKFDPTRIIKNVTPKNESKECKHLSYEVDEESRTVECDVCGKVLDPIWVLMQLCSRYDERDFKYEMILRHQKEQAEKSARRRERRKVS